MKLLVETVFFGLAVLLGTAVAVPPPTPSNNSVFSDTLSPSLTPCRSWVFPCLGGVYQCSNQSAYASFNVGPQPGCPVLPNSTATPPPATVCSLYNDTCSFVAGAPTCVSWLPSCALEYSCGTDAEFAIDTAGEDEECHFPVSAPPSPNVICIPVDNSCEWHNPCRTWLGWCQWGYHCGTEADYQAFLYGPQPLCFIPSNFTQPPPEGECVYQDGQCGWSECVSWLSPCQTGWECGSDYEHRVAQAYPPPPCPAPPPFLLPPPEPGVCQISLKSGTCEFQGQPECTGGKEYTTCGSLCPRTCENYQLDFACPSFDCAPGCFCPPDTVLHGDECVPSWQCPGANPCYLIDCAPGYECLVYEATGEGYCSPNCEELNPCAANEECVLTNVTCFRSPCPPVLSCEGGVCTGGKEWQDCGTACPLSCSNYTSLVACTEQCVQGCFCPEGTYIHEGSCVPITDCPDYISQCALILCPAGHICVDNGPYDAYCEPSCDSQYQLCGEGQICELIEQECEGRSPCPRAYRCIECTGGKQWMDCGTACPSTCDNYDVPVACTLQCVSGCFCPPGKVDVDGVCVDPSMCSVCDGCKEGEVCSVVNESNGAQYTICKGPITVPCSGSLPLSACAPSYRCIQHNTTGSRHCLQSCYLENGGCSDDQICYYERKEEECNQLLEPCFKTACTDILDEVEEDACPIGWESSVCASACQPTCEGYLRPQLRSTACITVCAKCQCPFGMVVFRGRCVDPLECYILLNESIPLNPLPQPDNVMLIKFTLSGVGSEEVDGAEFATMALNVLLKHGVNLPVEVYAVLMEDGNTVIVLKLTAEPSRLRYVANLLMNNQEDIGVSSAAIVDTRQDDDDDDGDGDHDDDDDHDSDDLSTGLIVGSTLAVIFVCSLLILAVLIMVALIFKRRNLKMTNVQISLDENKKHVDSVSFARLVNAENDYEIS